MLPLNRNFFFDQTGDCIFTNAFNDCTRHRARTFADTSVTAKKLMSSVCCLVA
jgi:hypothetical protein